VRGVIVRIINDITPTKRERERVEKAVEGFLREVSPFLKDAKAVVGGSIAKDTWLSGSCDVDIFVKFPYDKYKEKDISKVLEGRIKKHKKLHGSRDYFQIKKGRYIFELIPVLDVKSSKFAKNITDMSPLHSEWVKRNLLHPDQARLAKKFCKANGIYGAESYIRGFSGYVLEILISRYGDFFKLAKEASSWGESNVIDVGRNYPSVGEIMRKMNKSKLSNLVIVDPVQPQRNAAAGLSEDKYRKFIELCKEFLRNPSDKFFEEGRFSLSEIRKEAGNDKFFLMKAYPLPGKRDVSGSKLLKAFVYIRKKLEEEGFETRKADWNWEKEGKAYFWYYVRKDVLPEYYRHYGPPLKEEKHVEEFKKRWGEEKVKEEDGRVYVEVRREFVSARDYIKEVLKDGYLHENVRKIRLKRVTFIR
jgi:tRNA nucleotidyltransferase (CCA-adding enzyme)